MCLPDQDERFFARRRRADAVRRAAREELKNGAHQIKVMAGGGVASPTDPIDMVQYTGEEIRAAVTEASARRTYVL